MNEQEQKAVISICILAAFADGAQSETERAQIQRIADGFNQGGADLAAAYQATLGGSAGLKTIAQGLATSSAKSLSYEMAVCVCNADGVLSDAEKQFLTDLRVELGLDTATTAAIHSQATQLITLDPMSAPPRIAGGAGQNAELDRMILNCAILNGALELLPHSLATMAIIPLQMRMVYKVGHQYGFELDRGHITDFLATVGVGLTAQVVEGFARRLATSFTREIGGRLLGSLVGQATGSAVAFGTTYALGQVAKRYYEGGRTLTAAQLKEVFASMLSEGNTLQSRYASEIIQKSRTINVADLVPLVRQS